MQSQAKDEALTLKNIYLSGKELRESYSKFMIIYYSQEDCEGRHSYYFHLVFRVYLQFQPDSFLEFVK